MRLLTNGMDRTEHWEVVGERERFSDAMRELFRAVVTERPDLWGTVERREREARHTRRAEVCRDLQNGLVDPGPKRYPSDRSRSEKESDRLALDNALRATFRDVLVRVPDEDGDGFLWDAFEDAFPELAADVMDHAEIGSTEDVDVSYG